jgi:leader peptidase (prepilin peptidase) / N-methyltransferase
LELFLIVITGLIIGSFLNVVALRIPEGESVVYPPSHCPHCQHQLHARDLVPVFSFLWLRGKCRYCLAKISWQYPLGELFTAGLFAVTYLVLGLQAELAIGLVFAALVVAVTLADLRTMLIPDKILLAAMVLLVPLRIWQHPLGWGSYLWGMFIGGGIILALILWSYWWLKKEGMGMGDMKLMLVVGWVVGIQNTLLTLFLASFVGGLIGVLLIVTKLRKREEYIPFGPFLALGAWVSYLWGDQMIEWYLNLMMPGY